MVCHSSSHFRHINEQSNGFKTLKCLENYVKELWCPDKRVHLVHKLPDDQILVQQACILLFLTYRLNETLSQNQSTDSTDRSTVSECKMGKCS